ncbi:MAG TPA: ribonuclease P protein component [Candidatus Saccharimonadales bacterium]|nr:ribonuclease P protein component [Candidatus Saccharimonadales bacterium]
MISKLHRFHGHASLNFVYRHGVVVRDQHMSLRVARNNRRASYRAAVIVSRKVHKSAVRRNRIRRRIYEAVRLQSVTITEPYDLVFTVFSDQLADMPAVQLQALVERMLVKARVTKVARPASQPVRHDIVTRKED